MAIRVLLAVRAPLREAMREVIAAAGDCEVVGTADAPLDILLTVGASRADVVVVGAGDNGEPPGVVSHLLDEYPDVRVLCVAADRATVHLLRPVHVQVADISPRGLLNAIRALEYE
jgi:DNA-binding NarL/FixJ family response regulator